MARVMRTLVFTIHNPSRRTTATLHRALRAYTNAAAAVLEGAAREWDALCADAERDGTLNLLQLQRTLTRRYRSRTTAFPLHSSLRDAVFVDLAAQLSGYHALLKRWEVERDRVRAHIIEQGWSLEPLDSRAEAALRALGASPSWPNVPRTRPDYAAFDNALERLTAAIPAIPATSDAAGAMSPQRTTKAQRLRERLSEQASPSRDQVPHPQRLLPLVTVGVRPLLFPRPDGAAQARNFSLLRSEKDNRYYALLYLLPNKDARARPLAATTPDSKHGQLVALHPSAAVVERSTKPSLALCLPLECGAWHIETALEEAVAHPEMVRVARLYFRPTRRSVVGHHQDRFLLAITFEHDIPDRRVTTAHMAVAMDEWSRVAWRVYDDSTRRELAHGIDESLVGLQERWRRDRRRRARGGQLDKRSHRVQAEQVKHAAHVLCNYLIAVANQHDARILMNDVGYLRQRRVVLERDEQGKREARSETWHDMMAEQQYRRATLISGKLEEIMRYKLPRSGLPLPLIVRGISPRDCAACGQRGAENGICGLCGEVLDAKNTARVIAARTPDVLSKVQAARARRLAGWGGDTLDTTTPMG